jgi:hypothetical protein
MVVCLMVSSSYRVDAVRGDSTVAEHHWLSLVADLVEDQRYSTK